MVYRVGATSCGPIKQANLFLLLHPRWWVDWPAITAVEQQLVLSPKGKAIASAAVQLIEGRDALGAEAQKIARRDLLAKERTERAAS